MDLNENHEEESGKMEPGELLEDVWFFGNSLHRKPRMLRSMSDPCTSSLLPAKSFDETYASINRQVTQSHGPQPPNLPRKLGKSDKKMIMSSMSSKGLHRAPSLPTTLQEPEYFHDDDEVEFSMGKLIRQASMKHSDRLPPRQHASKVLARNASLTMYGSRRDSEGFDQEIRPVIQRSLSNKPIKAARRNLTEFEYRELRGFNDLGFDLEQHESSPEDRNIIPPAPPVPKWGRGNGKKKSSEDMKAQIKFWARAVASNVRQEC